MQPALFLAILFATVTSLLGAGKQLGGVYTPAQTPALAPEIAQKKFQVPPGFEVRLFAAEPDVINPVAMTWDDRGRLWVVELFEYPLGAAPGAKPRDRIKILEDTNNDGRADKVTIFAEGLNLASGILLGYGGVFVGQTPYLLFLEDTNGDDHADKRTELLTGFGRQDTHELLNSFTWGPDGWLYMTQGVFTKTRAKNPNDPTDDGVYLDGGVGRFHPRTKKFEVFADGTSNPWGVDFDAAGNAFVSACVIDHFFHLSPGGLYQRQAAAPPNPYAYELLPSIVDHKHFRAAFAGCQIYQGNLFPEEYRGTVFMGNIHGSQINHDRLTPSGSTFKATALDDFLVANDGWFRPVSQQTGPDGALWVMDWYDKYPCYQNANADPEGVDREHGRIWRVVYVGNEPGKKIEPFPEKQPLSNLKTAKLVSYLDHPNIWQRRMAQRILSERRDPAAKKPLQRWIKNSTTTETGRAAFWTLFSSGLMDDAILDAAMGDRDPAMRMWAARFTGEMQNPTQRARKRLFNMASDAEPAVRVAVATACRQWSSGQLTVDAKPRHADTGVLGILGGLMNQPGAQDDRLLGFMVWTALEPVLALEPEETLKWLAERDADPLSSPIFFKAMRRLCDLNSEAGLNRALAFVEMLESRNSQKLANALEGLLEGQKGKSVAPHNSEKLLARLAASNQEPVRKAAHELGTLWGDAAALAALLKTVRNPALPPADRIRALQASQASKSDSARQAALSVLQENKSDELTTAALRALGVLGGDEIGRAIFSIYRTLSVKTKPVAIEVLASRGEWIRFLMEGAETKALGIQDFPPHVLRSLTQSSNPNTRERAIRTIGKYRDPEADKLKVIAEKKKVVLTGSPNLAHGREVMQKSCLLCHKFYGEGAEVGPDLTGVGRANLDALLANVITPSQIVGQGYENVEVETKDGRTVSGRLVENTGSRVKLLAAGPKEEIVGKPEIAKMRVSELSVMPEGLEQMPDEDFRDLIWYVLNPPQDKRPLTPELRRQLVGE